MSPSPRLLDYSQQVAYLMSFLLILVDRAGGELTIDNLSAYANRKQYLSVDLQVDNDRVVLTVTDEEPKKRHVP